jgi:1,4-dihydroxy-2-naphthoate octaprenyltransferase
LKIWIQAARPKTLWAGVAPVLIGAALAKGDGVFHAVSVLLALAGAILVQVGTNYCNDYCDFKKGADTAQRVGPVRATQAGLVTPRAMAVATVVVFALAAVVCSALVARAGWPLAVVGVVSILCGVLYTAGPVPLAYVGLGDLFVLIFFGPVAVAGTYYVQALALPVHAVLAGIAPGLLSVAILTVNNLRDIETDRVAGKRTLAVRFGKGFARGEYAACIFGAALVPLALYFATGRSGGIFGSLILLPGLATIRLVMRDEGAPLNPMLGRTALLLLAYSVLFSMGWLS